LQNNIKKNTANGGGIASLSPLDYATDAKSYAVC